MLQNAWGWYGRGSSRPVEEFGVSLLENFLKLKVANIRGYVLTNTKVEKLSLIEGKKTLNNVSDCKSRRTDKPKKYDTIQGREFKNTMTL